MNKNKELTILKRLESLCVEDISTLDDIEIVSKCTNMHMRDLDMRYLENMASKEIAQDIPATFHALGVLRKVVEQRSNSIKNMFIYYELISEYNRMIGINRTFLPYPTGPIRHELKEIRNCISFLDLTLE